MGYEYEVFIYTHENGATFNNDEEEYGYDFEKFSNREQEYFIDTFGAGYEYGTVEGDIYRRRIAEKDLQPMAKQVWQNNETDEYAMITEVTHYYINIGEREPAMIVYSTAGFFSGVETSAIRQVMSWNIFKEKFHYVKNIDGKSGALFL